MADVADRWQGERRASVDETGAFVKWLTRNNLQNYQQALEAEGYDDLYSVSVIPEDELDELCLTLKMKPGHRRKMPMLINKLRREIERKDKLTEAEQQQALSRRMWEIEKEKREMEEEEEDHRSRKQQEKTGKDVQDLPASETNVSLPDGKRYGYFASHKSALFFVIIQQTCHSSRFGSQKCTQGSGVRAQS